MNWTVTILDDDGTEIVSAPLTLDGDVVFPACVGRASAYRISSPPIPLTVWLDLTPDIVLRLPFDRRCPLCGERIPG